MELTKEAILELSDKANAMPNSEAKLALLEQAISMADRLEDVNLGFELRESLMHVASYFGHSEKSLVAYAWCLARFDEKPEDMDYFQTRTLYWNYKWILGDLIEFPTIPLQKALDLHEDFARRYREAGHSERTVHYYNMRFAKHRGLKEEAKQHYDLWQGTKRDGYSDCHACETSVMVTYHTFMNDDLKAIETAQPVLEGKQRCASEPRDTYGNVLLPLVRLGKLEDASKYHEKGIALFKNSQDSIDSLGDHLRYLALVNKLDKALALFEQHIAWALQTAELHAQLNFLMASHLMLQRFLESGETELSVRLPQDHPLFKENRQYEISELNEHFYQQITSLSERFDQRNQTSHFKERIQQEKELLKIIQAS